MEKKITLKAYAKINLCLDVVGKRPDGYHEVSMVMQQIGLWDRVDIRVDDKQQEKAVTVSTNLHYLPEDKSNIAYQAAEIMREKAGGKAQDVSIHIDLQKRIPVAAGMAGGSADGAAVLHGLNILFDLNLSLEQLMKIGEKIGADVPFCIMGQAKLNPGLGMQKDGATCALAEGIGTKLTPLPPLFSWVLVSKPPISVSTAFVYKNLELKEIIRRPDTEELIQGIKENNLHKVSRNMVNVLENVSLKEYPIIVYTKNKIEEMTVPERVLMSGSGPAVYALFPVKEKAKKAFYEMKKVNRDTFLVKTV